MSSYHMRQQPVSPSKHRYAIAVDFLLYIPSNPVSSVLSWLYVLGANSYGGLYRTNNFLTVTLLDETEAAYSTVLRPVIQDGWALVHRGSTC
jgi:hypothetical protein